MAPMQRLIALLAVTATTCSAEDYFPLMPTPLEVKVTLGQHRVVMPNGHDGLTNFPDMPIVELSARPLTFLVVGGIGETFLLRGESYETSRIAGRVLPPGPAGSVDNQYAGISSVYVDRKRKKLVAFYHAEDGEQMPKCSNGVCGAYWSLCVAESPLDKLEFTKLGRFITADQPKKLNAWETEGGPREAWLIQGTGNPWVMPDVENKHLLCFYIEASNRLKERRGCQICMARAPIESAGLPGSWKKYFQGDFSEPGLGGHDTPVITASPNAETADPFVLYVKPWKRYVMFMMMAVYTEMNGSPPAVKESGFYISTSVDALEWTKPVKIATLFPVPSNGRPCSMRPHLVGYTATARSLKGTLRYAHSEDWGRVPQYLAESPIMINLAGQTQSKKP